MSADDNAPEQAREVEVVREALLDSLGWDWTEEPPHVPSPEQAVEGVVEAVLAALAPIRAAERQEAAREALIEAAGDIAERIAAVVDPDSWRRDGFDEGWAHAGEKIDGLLRDRADGVTGREGE